MVWVLLLVACGPALDADGDCVAPLTSDIGCPTEEDCDLDDWESEACGAYTRVTCSFDYGGTTWYCDGDERVVALTKGSDTEEYCDGQSYEVTYGEVPESCLD